MLQIMVAALAAQPLRLLVQKGSGPGGDGSVLKPFSSLSECAAAAPGGQETICSMGPGVFHESVQILGGRSAPLVIEGAGEQITTMTGAEPVTGKWERYKGNIWKTTLPPAWMDVEQVFVDENMAFEARWPNVVGWPSLDAMAATSRTWEVTVDSQVPPGGNPNRDPTGNQSAPGYVTSQAVAETGIDFTGALITLNVGSRFFSQTRTVADHTAGSNNLTYYGVCYWEGQTKHTTLPNLFFLTGIFDALDSPGEWWLNKSTGEFFMWSPDGEDLAGRVRVKTHDVCINVQGPQGAPTEIRNMSLTACTFVLGVDGSAARDLNLTFPSYAREITFRNAPSPGVPPTVTSLFCNDCVAERLSIRYSNIAGVLSIGSGNTMRELLIEDNNWFGTLDFPGIQVGFGHMVCKYTNASTFDPAACGHMLSSPSLLTSDPGRRLGHIAGFNNVIERVSMHRFSNDGIVTSQFSNEVSYVWLKNGTNIGLDSAALHADNLDSGKEFGLCYRNNCTKHWHHNWIHSHQEKGMRGDDASFNMTVNNNVIYDCALLVPRASGAGILIKGDFHNIYANTVFGCRYGQGEIIIDTRTGSPCPINVTGGCVKGNSHTLLFNNVGKEKTKGKATPIPQQVAFYGGNVFGNGTGVELRDPDNYDFRPQSATLIGQGVAKIPFTPPGANPDVGAYQHDDKDPWVPGCTFKPECKLY